MSCSNGQNNMNMKKTKTVKILSSLLTGLNCLKGQLNPIAEDLNQNLYPINYNSHEYFTESPINFCLMFDDPYCIWDNLISNECSLQYPECDLKENFDCLSQFVYATNSDEENLHKDIKNQNQKKRKEIREKIIKGKTSQQCPIVISASGPAGAGKNYGIDKIYKETNLFENIGKLLCKQYPQCCDLYNLQIEDFVMLDNDDIMIQMDPYKSLSDWGKSCTNGVCRQITSRVNAKLGHGGAKIVYKEILNFLIKNKMNFLTFGTSADPISVEKKIYKYKKNGYKGIVFIHVDTTIETSFFRVIERAFTKKRPVRLPYVFEQSFRNRKALPSYIKNSDIFIILDNDNKTSLKRAYYNNGKEIKIFNDLQLENPIDIIESQQEIKQSNKNNLNCTKVVFFMDMDETAGYFKPCRLCENMSIDCLRSCLEQDGILRDGIEDILNSHENLEIIFFTANDAPFMEKVVSLFSSQYKKKFIFLNNEDLTFGYKNLPVTIGRLFPDDNINDNCYSILDNSRDIIKNSSRTMITSYFVNFDLKNSIISNMIKLISKDDNIKSLQSYLYSKFHKKLSKEHLQKLIPEWVKRYIEFEYASQERKRKKRGYDKYDDGSKNELHCIATIMKNHQIQDWPKSSSKCIL